MVEISLPDGRQPWTPDTLPADLFEVDLDDEATRQMVRESQHDPYTYLLLLTHAELHDPKTMAELSGESHAKLIEGVNQEIRRRRRTT